MFESLDFLYVPAPDIEASISYYTNILGNELLWKIHAFGVWVACVRVSNSGPLLLLADHIKKNDLIMIYRVSSLDSTASTLHSQGWKEEKMLEIPPGPCYTFRDPAGNAIAIYENLRPEVMEQFDGRIDKL
jgi:catechol 2,3-dioxygenase-like lactoylglutathione lyase family enzyme